MYRGGRTLIATYIVAAVFFTAAEFTVSAQKISGRVTCQGKGVENVVVSNGYDVTVTDSKGKYVIDNCRMMDFVFVSTPSGYRINSDKGIPRFFQRIDQRRSDGYDFNLDRLAVPDINHAFFLHADPQFYREQELAEYEKTVDDCISLLSQYPEKDNVFGIDCGDMVFDRPALYQGYIERLDKLGVPFFRVPGNHDMTYNHRADEDSYTLFEDTFGPTCYSFNRGKAHYVVLDDVFYLGRDYYYIGYLTEDILTWLEKDLSYVPEGSLVFVALHIPSSLEDSEVRFSYDMIRESVTNHQALYSILKPYRAHILSGHTHYNRNLIHSDSLCEHINAAICGAWWQGPVGVDGTPLGYQFFTIQGDSVSWFYKSIGHDKNFQCKVYPAGADEKYPDEIIVNVWNWAADWSVRWTEDGRDMGEMTRYEGIDPDARRYYGKDADLFHKWTSPAVTSHLFRARPSSPDAKTEIVVTDSFGRVYRVSL